MKSTINTEANFNDIIKVLGESNHRISKLNLSSLMLNNNQLDKLYDTIQNNHIIFKVKWNDQQTVEAYQNKIDQIENKLKQNMSGKAQLKGDVCIHAIFSAHVLEKDIQKNGLVILSDEKQNKKFMKQLSGWKVEEIFDQSQSKIYAVLYSHPLVMFTVLAFRGLVFQKKDLLGKKNATTSFIEGVIRSKISSQLEGVYKIAQEVHHKGYQFTSTGYGLGGWYAELANLFANKDFQVKSTQAIVFDSPGIATILNEIKSNIKNDQNQQFLNKLNIQNYLLAPNPMNCCGQKLGKAYRVFPKLEFGQFIQKSLHLIDRTERFFGQEGIASNKVKGIEAFWYFGINFFLDDVFDEQTGEPIECEEVLDWPSISYDKNKQSSCKTIVKGAFKSLFGSCGFCVAEVSSSLVSIIFNGIAGDIALTSIITILIDILNNNLETSQYWKVFQYLEREKSYRIREGYEVNFNLKYEAKYSTRKIQHDKIILSEQKYSTDWYLKKLYINKQVIIPYLNNHIEVQQKVQTILQNYDIIFQNEQNYLKPIGNASAKKIQYMMEDILTKFSSFKFTIITSNSMSLEIVKKEKETDISQKIHYLYVSKLDNFVGREDDFNILEDIFKKSDICYVHSVGGIGKSTFVAHFFHLRKPEAIVRWFNCSKGIAKPFIDFAQDLNIQNSMGMDREIIKNQVMNKLDILDEVWFVFDNVEQFNQELEFYTQYDFKSSLKKSNIKIIITTRYPGLNEKWPSIKLNEFSQAESTLYLTKSLVRKTTPDQIVSLITKIDSSNPQDLYLTSEFLNNNPFLRIQSWQYNKHNSVIASIIDKNVKNTSTYNLLSFLTLIDPDFIELGVLYFFFDELAIQDDLNLLIRNSLIEIITDKENLIGIKIHRKIQKQYLDFLQIQKHQQNEIIEKVKKYLEDNFKMVDKHKKYNLEGREFFSHVKHFTEFMESNYNKVQSMLILRLMRFYLDVLFDFDTSLKIALKYIEQNKDNHDNLFYLAKMYEGAGDSMYYLNDDSRVDHYIKAQTIYRQYDPKDNLTISKLMSYEGQALSSKGNLKESQEKQIQALKLLESCEIKDINTHIDILNCIAQSYLLLNDKQQAKEYCLQALNMVEQDGVISSVISSCYNHCNTYQILGQVYGHFNDIEKQREYSIKSYEITKAFFTGDNPNIISAISSLGDIFDKQEAGKGMEYRQQALEMSKRIYPYFHQKTAIALNNLATSYYSLSKVDESIAYQKESLSILQKLYTDKPHFITVTILSNLGTFYYEQGDTDQSIGYLLQAKQMCEVYYQNKHAQAFNTFYLLGIILMIKGDTEKSNECFSQALNIMQMNDDTNQKMKGNILFIMATNSITSQRIEEGFQYIEQALPTFKLYPDESEQYLPSVLQLISVCREEDKQLLYRIQVSEIIESQIHPNQEVLADNFQEICQSYCKQGNLEKGREYCDKYISILKQFDQSKKKKQIAEILFSIGFMHIQNSEVSMGLNYLSKSLEILNEMEDTDIELKQLNLKFLIQEHSKLQQYDKSIEFCLQELALYELNQQADTEVCASLVTDLGKFYNKQGISDKAIVYSIKGLQTIEQVSPDNYKLKIQLYKNLLTAYIQSGQTQLGLDYGIKLLQFTQDTFTQPHPLIIEALQLLGATYYNLQVDEKGLYYTNLAENMQNIQGNRVKENSDQRVEEKDAETKDKLEENIKNEYKVKDKYNVKAEDNRKGSQIINRYSYLDDESNGNGSNLIFCDELNQRNNDDKDQNTNNNYNQLETNILTIQSKNDQL